MLVFISERATQINGKYVKADVEFHCEENFFADEVRRGFNKDLTPNSSLLLHFKPHALTPTCTDIYKSYIVAQRPDGYRLVNPKFDFSMVDRIAPKVSLDLPVKSAEQILAEADSPIVADAPPVAQVDVPPPAPVKRGRPKVTKEIVE